MLESLGEILESTSLACMYVCAWACTYVTACVSISLSPRFMTKMALRHGFINVNAATDTSGFCAYWRWYGDKLLTLPSSL